MERVRAAGGEDVFVRLDGIKKLLTLQSVHLQHQQERQGREKGSVGIEC